MSRPYLRQLFADLRSRRIFWRVVRCNTGRTHWQQKTTPAAPKPRQLIRKGRKP